MSTFLRDILRVARADKKRIVLPEGDDPRMLEAAKIAIEEGVADLVLLGEDNKNIPRLEKMGLNCSTIRIVNPATSGRIETYATALHELRKHRGMTLEDAGNLVRNPIYFGMMMLSSGEVDGLVAGAVHSTADIIRPALQIIKTAPDIKTVSAMFFIIKGEKTYLFADCGLNQNPDAGQLADIAFSTALTAKLFGVTPRIAMLSYSTRGSGQGESVAKMARATVLAKTRLAAEYEGKYSIDGELQFDAAFVPAIAARKCPDSPLQGQANIFIFPDLDAGNIAYKLANRLAGADAYGPILQGMARPANDLSRGCSSSDIVATIAITAIQAQMEKH